MSQIHSSAKYIFGAYMTLPAKLQTALQWLIVCVGGVFLGFMLSIGQIINIDDQHNLGHGAWLLFMYGLGPETDIRGLTNVEWYGPLFDVIVVGTSRTIFASLHNPFWVMRALCFALLPITGLAVYKLLRRAEVSRSTIWVALALLIGMIRLGGHALINQKDFPFACAFLIATLYIWVAMRDIYAKKDVSMLQLLNLGIITILPFLIRPVPPLHLAICVGMLYFFVTIGPATCNWKKAVLIPVIPCTIAGALIYLMYPPLHYTPIDKWIDGFGIFSSYPWRGYVRAFGMGFMALTNLAPRWYIAAWLPVLMNPVAFLFFGVGLLSALQSFWKGPALVVDIFRKRLPISLGTWLLLFTILSWGSVIILQPNLYDEERHLLFTYPPLAILAALGMQRFTARYRAVVASIVISCSAISYGYWQYYSYVYKNPLATPTESAFFMGDYWGVCAENALRALYDSVPAGTALSIPWIHASSMSYLDILHHGNVPGFSAKISPQYRLDKPTYGEPYAIFRINRVGDYEKLLRESNADRPTSWQLIWTERMPPHDISCGILYTPSYEG